MQRQIREDELRTKTKTQKGMGEEDYLGGRGTTKLKVQTSFMITVSGWVRGTEGKGDLPSRPFCEAEIQAFPLTLECHSEAQ